MYVSTCGSLQLTGSGFEAPSGFLSLNLLLTPLPGMVFLPFCQPPWEGVLAPKSKPERSRGDGAIRGGGP